MPRKPAVRSPVMWLSRDRDAGYDGEMSYNLTARRPHGRIVYTGDASRFGPSMDFCSSMFEKLLGHRLEPGQACRVRVTVEPVGPVRKLPDVQRG